MPSIAHLQIVKRERGRYVVMGLVPETDGHSQVSRDLGEVRRHGRYWRHLLAPEREFFRMRDCAADLVYAFEHPERI